MENSEIANIKLDACYFFISGIMNGLKSGTVKPSANTVNNLIYFVKIIIEIKKYLKQDCKNEEFALSAFNTMLIRPESIQEMHDKLVKSSAKDVRNN